MDTIEKHPPAGDSWRKLANEVGQQAAALRDLASGSPFAPQAVELAENASHLASQIERLADAASGLLNQLGPPNAGQPTDSTIASEIEQEMIQIQRETHDGNVELLDVVKALFMWRDDPAERVRGRHQPGER